MGSLDGNIYALSQKLTRHLASSSAIVAVRPDSSTKFSRVIRLGGRDTPTATRPSITLKRTAALDKLERLTQIGTMEERESARELLVALQIAAKFGVPSVKPDLQRTVVDLLPSFMSKQEESTVINKGLVEMGLGHPDKYIADPNAPKKEMALLAINKLVAFGNENERDEAKSLLNSITIAKSRGLNAVRPDMQRSVHLWLEPLFGKEVADKIISGR